MILSHGDIVELDGRLFRLQEFNPTPVTVVTAIPDEKFEALGERQNLPDLNADAPPAKPSTQEDCQHVEVLNLPPELETTSLCERHHRDRLSEKKAPEPEKLATVDDDSLGARLTRFQEEAGMTDMELSRGIGVHHKTLQALRAGTARGKSVSKAEMFLNKTKAKAPAAAGPGICLRQVVGAYLKQKNILPGDAAEHFGIRGASFLAIMNSGPPPLQDTVFALAEKIPEVQEHVDDLINARLEWEKNRKDEGE